jgi:2',3'-cyclic-nucleotide 2'-phosphodiesterase/3'-nucleotidase
MTRLLNGRILTVALLMVVTACASTGGHGPGTDVRATLAVLATSDLHGHVLGYDYYRLREDPTVGFDRVATVVAQMRARYPNTVLVDNGDTIQGTPLADWQARVQPPRCDERLAIYAAMDLVGFDAATLGNHEFNYGLPFLSQVTGEPIEPGQPSCRGPDFPLVLSNVVDERRGQALFPPRLMIERALRDDEGRDAGSVRIGMIGLTPPGILRWDARHLRDRVRLVDALTAVRGQVDALRASGADIVIALVHGGLDAQPYDSGMDNPGWHIAASGLVDALVLGHDHRWFPDPEAATPAYAQLPEVDVVTGRVHGVPAVMPAYWGRALGVIELPLLRRDGRWQVERERSRSRVIATAPAGQETVAPEPAIARLVDEAHRGAMAYMEQPVAHSELAMTTFFADVGDTSAIDVVNRAQADFLRAQIESAYPALRELPVLSAAAPFKTGAAGPDDYTQVPAGTLAIRHAADLYLYPNTLVAVKISGAQLRTWLEQSARRFRQIDPESTAPQALVDDTVPGYNFDVIDGVHYVIDLTRAPGERIVALDHPDGRPVDPQEWLLVATNNYRAGSGGAFGLSAESVVIDTQVANRDVLIDWLRAQGRVDARPADSTRPWRFAPLPPAVQVLFTTRDGLPEDVTFGSHQLRRLGALPDHRARYRLTVAK